MQIFGIVTVVNHDFPLFVVNNNFTENTGTKGVLFITGKTLGGNKRRPHPIVVAENRFERNSGYMTSNAVSIKIVNDEMNDELNPDSLKCSHLLLSKNTFLNNIGAFQETSGALNINCFLDPENPDNDKEGKFKFEFPGIELPPRPGGTDPFNNVFLLDQYKARLTGFDFSTLGSETLTYTIEGNPYVTYQNQVLLSENTFEANFASKLDYVVRITGIPYLTLQNEYYINNGDVFPEAYSKYSKIAKIYTMAPEIEDSFPTILGNTSKQLTTLKAYSVLGIIGGGKVTIKDSNFLKNWHKEFPSDLQTLIPHTSQAITFHMHFGEAIN